MTLSVTPSISSPPSSTPKIYTRLARVLHWLIGLGFLGVWGLGFYMTYTEAYPLYSLHKQLGVVLLVLMGYRAIVRLKQGWPAPATVAKKWEQILARSVHWGLLVAILCVPIAGLVYSGASGHGVQLLGVDLIPSRYSSAGEAIPYSEYWRDTGQWLHWVLGYIFMGAIGLHIAAALKHHFVNKDSTLRRMLGV